jgi:ligand-binding sensor domain-containing protein/anti-sigma regulatory factor (Ser/Thr protein kinase)
MPVRAFVAVTEGGAVRRFLSGCALVLGLMGTAAAERLPIKTYTTADGLAHLRVSCITVDSRGFLWFCGPQGLSRFDGQGFVTYGVAEGLVNTLINDFRETSLGEYWVATNGGGVYRFTPAIQGRDPRPAGRRGNGDDAASASRFTAFPLGDDPQTNRVNVLYEDRQRRLWAGSDGGLFCLDRSSEPAAFERVTLDLPSRPDRAVQIWALVEDHEGNLWMGTSWGVVRRSPHGRTLHIPVQPAQGMDQVRALLIDRDHRIWIGHDTGLIVYRPGLNREIASSDLARTSRKPRAPRTLELPAAPGDAERYGLEDGLAGGGVRALLQSSDGQVWIGTLDGLTRFDGERFGAFTRAQGINRVNALAEDREGNIWSGTLATGAMRLARNGFSAYTEADGLANATIRGVFESRTGDLYVVSANQRIHRFDGSGFTAVRPNLSEDVAEVVNPGMPLRDRTGEWWIPGGAGVYRFPNIDDVQQLARIQPKAIHTTLDGLAGDDVFNQFEDARGDIWIGRRIPTSSVLTRWERATGIFHPYSDADGLPSFSRTTAFAEDHAGNVWIGFQNGGLARYRSGRFRLFTHADGAPAGGIEALYVDHDGRLWVGSARPGLTRIDDPAADPPRFVPYTSAQGLLDDIVHCITEDQLGRLYLGMPSGRIDRLDLATGRVRHYNAADGLAGAPLTAAVRDRSGSLWFGSYDALYRLVPVPDRPRSPPVVLIGGLRVAGESRLASDLGESEIPRFELESTQNQLQIDFFGLGEGPGDELRYQYQLEGADRDWNAPTNHRSVNYASLAPGRYRFVVRAVATDGSVGQNPAAVAFTILPPIWQRTWFLTLAAIVMTAGAYLLYRTRVAQLLAVERVRMRIAADLHDDIGGSLSRIAIQSEVAGREAARLGEQPAHRLLEIADGARGLVDALGDVVWSVDPRRDDLASVCRRIREYADDLLAGSGMRWTCALSPNLESVKLDPQARRDLFLLLKEAVTNVARHASARSASMEFTLTNREFRAELRDDGRGFDPTLLECEDHPDRHGITSMRRRAERLGGRLTIQSSHGIGTTVSLQMPLRRPLERMTMLLSRRLR